MCVQGLVQFHKMHCVSGTVLKGDFYAAVAQSKIGGVSNPCALFRTAIVKAAISCPESHVRNGECRWIKESEVPRNHLNFNVGVQAVHACNKGESG